MGKLGDLLANFMAGRKKEDPSPPNENTIKGENTIDIDVDPSGRRLPQQEQKPNGKSLPQQEQEQNGKRPPKRRK